MDTPSSHDCKKNRTELIKNIQQNPQLDTAIGRNCMECNSPLFMLKWVCIYGKNGTLELCRCCFDEYDK